jgi:two-component system cell cycle response regulator
MQLNSMLPASRGCGYGARVAAARGGAGEGKGIAEAMSARILIVDDMLSSLRLMEAKLSAEYYEVATASDGHEALALAARWAPDLVLLDVMMPGLDGYEVCAALKASRETEHVPVVMLTALGDSGARVRGLEVGADDFLTKPVEDGTLFARVRSLVRLKRLLDEWRLRSATTQQLGVNEASPTRPGVEGAFAMIVDDHAPDAELAAAALARDGIRSLRAPDVGQALTAARGGQFDLIVLNLALGADDPLRLASRLRAEEATREIPLLLIADPEHRDKLVRGFDLGVNDYVMRPIDENELRARARNQIRRRFYQERLRADLQYSISLALTDGLTGVYNQRYLRGHLKALADQAALAGGQLGVLMIDLDRFKSINDRHGHAAGDTALKLVADAIRQHVRVFDTVARYGGEEFVVVMPGATKAEGEAVAERLRCAIAGLHFIANGVPMALTVSIGVAALPAVLPLGPHPRLDEALLHAADAALYRAKAAGRNRVEVTEAA